MHPRPRPAHGYVIEVDLADDVVVDPLGELRRPKYFGSRCQYRDMELIVVQVDNPEGLNLILGQSHFIKTVEDLHEALAGSSPQIRFGLAFCESSGPRLVRRSGNDDELARLAGDNALQIGAGHSFIVFLRDAFPLNVLNAVKTVPEVCHIYCATANPLSVVLAETAAGRGILGVIDGGSPLGIESAADVTERRDLLRSIGYKL